MDPITADDVARGLLDEHLPIERRIHLAILADEFDDPLVLSALEKVVGSEDVELAEYAGTSLANLWVLAGAPDIELFSSLSYHPRNAIRAVLLHRAPGWLARL